MPRDSYVPRLDGADSSLSPVLLIEVSLSVYLSVYVSVYVRVHVAATMWSGANHRGHTRDKVDCLQCSLLPAR